MRKSLLLATSGGYLIAHLSTARSLAVACHRESLSGWEPGVSLASHGVVLVHLIVGHHVVLFATIIVVILRLAHAVMVHLLRWDLALLIS